MILSVGGVLNAAEALKESESCSRFSMLSCNKTRVYQMVSASAQ